MQHMISLLAALLATAAVAAEPMVVTGRQHALYLADDGTVWAWGANSQGQLGVGDTNPRLEPVQVPGLADIIQVSAGMSFSLALSGDGSVYAWGSNAYAEGGTGTAGGMRTSPGLVLGGVKQIAAGGYHALALLTDGSIRAWGYNGTGCVGNGSTTSPVTSPVAVTTSSRFRAIAGGGLHSLAIRDDGTLWSWGSDAQGQLGNDAALSDATSPVLVAGLNEIMAVSAGYSHSLAVVAGSSIYAWGGDTAGQLGDNVSLVNQPIPVWLSGSTCLRPATGYASSVVMRTNGYISLWGDNACGQTRQSPGSPATQPLLFSPGMAVRSTSTGFGDVVLAIGADGTVVAWGDNSSGQLGIGSLTPACTGTPVTVHANWPVSRATAAVRGQYHGAALKSDGTVWGWSGNNNGQVGDGTTSVRSTPVQASGVDHIVAIASGGDFGDTVIALSYLGQVVAWGRNDVGQIGDGTTTSPHPTPATLPLSGCRGIASGDSHTLAITGTGTVRAWGSDAKGQLGDDAALASSTTPLAVDTTAVHGVLQIAAGNAFSAALRADGTVWTWGADTMGQLGNDATMTDRPTPVQVSGLTGVVQIVAGSYHMLALRSDGTVAAWGLNGNGQLGDATTTNRAVPVTVLGAVSGNLAGVRSLAAGANHSCAILGDGSIRAWGSGAQGCIGDGGTADRNRPVAVALPGCAATVDGGYAGTVAVLADGRVWSWGYNGTYANGDGTSVAAATPVPTTPEWLPQVTVDTAGSLLAASESGPVHGSVRIVRTGSTAGSLAVSVTMSGSATQGIDYTTTSAVTIPWGQSAASIAVTVVDDHRDEVAETVNLGVAAAPDRLRLAAPDAATVTIADDDVAGIQVWPTTGLGVSEAGGQAVIAMVLGSQPSADVSIAIGPASGDTTRISLSPTSLTFTSTDWDQVHLVTITGLADQIADGGHLATVVIGAAVSGDDGYDGLDADDPSVTCFDDDQRGVVIAESDGSTAVAEGGHGDTYSLALASQPIGVVAISLQNDGQVAATGPRSGAVVYFAATALGAGDGSSPADAAAWYTQVGIQIEAVDDRIAEGGHAGQLRHTASGGGYDGVPVATLAVGVSDDDIRSVAVSAPSSPTTEIGGTATFTVVLTSQPTAEVSIPVASADPGQGVAAPTVLAFTPTDWQTPRTVTVTGQDGAGYDHGAGSAYGVILGVIAGASDYAGTDPADAVLLNIGVNHPPTCDLVADVVLEEDAAPTTVVMTGISAGQPGEVQAISFTVASDTPAVVADPVLVWPGSGGATTAGLVLTPVAGASGTATITIILHDDGGTVHGGIDTSVRTCRVTVGAVSDAPVVTLPGASLDVIEQASAAVVDPGAMVTDGDSPSLDGGCLRAGFGVSAHAGDILAFPGAQGGDPVSVGGVVIGTIDPASDGCGGRDLIVRFRADGSATPVRVGALLAQLAYRTIADDPPRAPRSLAVVVEDGSVSSVPAVVAVTVLPVDDPPLADPVHPLVLVPGIELGGQVVAADPEGGPLAYALELPPVHGVVADLDPAHGTFRYRVSSACTAVNDAFGISVSDGVNLVHVTVAVRITQVGAPGPVVISPPPMTGVGGSMVTYQPTVLTNGLALPSLHFRLIGSVPGATIDAATGQLSVPMAAPADGSGYIRGGILVVDDTSGTAGFQPFTIRYLPGASG